MLLVYKVVSCHCNKRANRYRSAGVYTKDTCAEQVEPLSRIHEVSGSME